MIEPKAGILLIAEPFLKDPNFVRTVIFLCEHQEEGSFGFVLNKNYDFTLNELLPDMENIQLPVYYGGPVQPDTLHFLHQLPELIPGGLEVANGIYWGGDYELTMSLLKKGEINTQKIRFFIGYSGWGNGQLDDEMKEKTWLTVAANPNLVFHRNLSDIWKDSLKELGGEYEQLINYPVDPQLN
ncbi:MAG TPA: YqgE/AlgH family protein [Chitinophagaceae bacterium]|nr:YqgE/AlgH family protein [Chitinophagaceae bacterium]